MLKRMLTLSVVAAAACLATAADVPKEIKARYDTLNKIIKARDVEGFKTFFAPEFVNIDPKGAKVDRKEFLKMIDGIFDGATKMEGHEKLISATTSKGVVAVKFDFKLTVTNAKGTTLYHEVGTDYWKKIDGRWVFVKTIDKKFDATPVK
ncbi:MAG: nuclear transport factor 2 family protein [Armatimonadetes bacterium]|nr:nuclear transport factor 2 family protein [Armatimonadota bacterium]